MPNRLAAESSPYLLQHADNPVDWYPWGEEALALARREGRPILLSIGYSACHWCHVMAHESFEDAETAALMNRLFVNIKVDREERPDLDQIYQLAHQMLARRSGGWPLTVFLTPEGVPFFSGTYYPKRGRYGLPSFTELLNGIARNWRDERGQIEAQNASLLAALQRTLPQPGAGRELDAGLLAAALEQLESNFDPDFGGFGGAPKFPHPGDLALLLRHGNDSQRRHVYFSLRQMALGGLFDQLGGGFFRYSVDERWEIPHFEKMLYDNALLLGVYADAWAQCGDPLFQRVVEMTIDWALREMRSPDGGFYAALDADTDGEEGATYVWSCEELKDVLAADEYAAFATAYGLDRSANFEGHAWHLQEVGKPANPSALASARARALSIRQQRRQPGCDDKVLAAWNGLMITGLLRAGRVFTRPEWIAAGQQTFDFVRREMWIDGRLRATWKNGQARLAAYLDDYACLLAAAIESMQSGFRRQDLAFALELGDALLTHFEDAENGAFYFTAHDHERLVFRAKVAHDAALPAGNGIAARALGQLAVLTGESRFADARERSLTCLQKEMRRAPAACASLLMALSELVIPPSLLVLRGPNEELAEWIRCLGVPTEGGLSLAVGPQEDGLPAPLDKPCGERVNAWLCEGVTCLPPIDGLSAFAIRFAKPGKGHYHSAELSIQPTE